MRHEGLLASPASLGCRTDELVEYLDSRDALEVGDLNADECAFTDCACDEELLFFGSL
jgi:hypothetical protein